MVTRELIEAITVIVLVGWNTYKVFKDRKEQKLVREKEVAVGLPPNPLRCAEHQEAINQIKEDVRQIKERLDMV